MYLLDSNILIYSYLKEHSFLKPYVLFRQNAFSAVSKVEALGFIGISPDESKYFNSIFKTLNAIHVDEAVLQKAIQIRQAKKIKLGDSLIAATALLFGLELATRNTSDFQGIPGLTVVNPFLEKI